MSRYMTAAALASALAAAAPVAAQQPRISNGRVSPQAAGASLEQTFRALVAAQGEPAWIGYAVPVVSGERMMCCSGDGSWISDGVVYTNGRWNGCGLETDGAPPARAGQAPAPRTPAPPVKLEGPDTLIVLYRVEDKAVPKIRVFSETCDLDAG